MLVKFIIWTAGVACKLATAIPTTENTGGLSRNDDILVPNEDICTEHTRSRYTDLKMLGYGSFSSVTKVRDECDGEEYAMKLFNDVASSLPGSYRYEVNMLNDIGEHKNIIPFLHTFIENDCGYALMPVMPGGDLFDLIEDRELSPDESRIAIKQILDAVAHVHSNDIVINDIKPENILIESTEPLHLRLSDFGLAINLRNGQPDKNSGSFGYSPFEKSYGIKIGAFKSDDIWAVGIIFSKLTFRNSLARHHNLLLDCSKKPDRLIDLLYGRMLGHGRIEEEYSKRERNEYYDKFRVLKVNERLEGFLSEVCTRYFAEQPYKCKEMKEFASQILNRNSKERASAEFLLQHPFLAMMA